MLIADMVRVGGLTACYIMCHKFLTWYNINGQYYILHAISNLVISWYSIGGVIRTYATLCDTEIRQMNNHDIIITDIIIALHTYHIIICRTNMRSDDWAHHIIMVAISMPILRLGLIPPDEFLQYSAFFVSGLPGFIDYSMLALCRNNIMDRMAEKKINSYLNAYLRNPGCISCVTLIILKSYRVINQPIEIISVVIICGAVFWNGVYFSNQVIADYAIRSNRITNGLVIQ